MALEPSYGVFPSTSSAFFQLQVVATAASSEKVSLLGRQRRVAADLGGSKRLLTWHPAASHSALLHTLLPCVRSREDLPSLALARLLPCRQKYEASYTAKSFLQMFISRRQEAAVNIETSETKC